MEAKYKNVTDQKLLADYILQFIVSKVVQK